MKKTLHALVALLCVGAVACGSGGGAKDDVKSTTKDFTSAFLDKDYGKACSLMTSQARKKLENAAKSLGKKGCAGTLESAATLLNDRARKKLRDYKVKKVEIKGDTATATDSTGQTQRLRKENGKWLIDTASGGNSG